VARALRTVARKAMLAALYWFVLSLITFLGMSAVIKIEATGMRLFLVVVVAGAAFQRGMSSGTLIARLHAD